MTDPNNSTTTSGASTQALIPSATVMLLRNGKTGLEVFMVVRHHQIDFASGALVFPGGKADPQDFDAALAPYLTGAAADDDLRAIQVSGIRELFEESGVLLARAESSADLVSPGRLKTLDSHREPLNSGELPLLRWLEQEALTLACDLLVPFAHWITPEMMPKRFDTHFFLAAAPADQLALHDGYESVDSLWINAKDALTGAAEGRYTIIFPTLRNLEKLAQFETVAEALNGTRAEPVKTVLPWTEAREDGTYLRIRDDAGYSHCEEKLPDRR